MFGVLSIDFLTGTLSFIFTLLILSYVVGDNPAFRMAVHIFAGVSAGYILHLVWTQVILNKLFNSLFFGTSLDQLLIAVPALILSLFLVLKVFPRAEWMGRWVVALLVGIGTAAAIGGAVAGTIFPQINATAKMFEAGSTADPGGMAANLLAAVCALLGTIFTLAYFQFTIRGGETSTGKRGWFVNFFALPGQAFISITLGAIFAGVLVASLTALINRVYSLIAFFF